MKYAKLFFLNTSQLTNLYKLCFLFLSNPSKIFWFWKDWTPKMRLLILLLSKKIVKSISVWEDLKLMTFIWTIAQSVVDTPISISKGDPFMSQTTIPNMEHLWSYKRKFVASKRSFWSKIDLSSTWRLNENDCLMLLLSIDYNMIGFYLSVIKSIFQDYF